MTVSLLARTAAATAATGAVLLGSLTVAGPASAGEDSPRTPTTTSAPGNANLYAPHVTVPHGRKIG